MLSAEHGGACGWAFRTLAQQFTNHHANLGKLPELLLASVSLFVKWG